MAVERTLSLIKPDATKRNITGAICKMIEDAGFCIIAQKRVKLTYEQASRFYAVHKDKPFYDEVCVIMSSGPIVAMVLEKENAIADYRTLMGATIPSAAESGTIRKQFGESVDKNSVHGSDSAENAEQEIKMFFNELEIIG